METQSQYRKFGIVRGDAGRTVHGMDAKRRITRELHGVVLAATDRVTSTVPTAHQNWAFDLRRGRMRVYGSLLRCIDLLHRKGCPKEIALMIPQWIAWYVEELYEGTPTERPAAQRALGVRKAS